MYGRLNLREKCKIFLRAFLSQFTSASVLAAGIEDILVLQSKRSYLGKEYAVLLRVFTIAGKTCC